MSSYLHLNELRERYNWGNVCILNLIRQKEGKQNENTIGERFREFWSYAMENKKKPIKAVSTDDSDSIEVVKYVEKEESSYKENYRDEQYDEGSESENEFDYHDEDSTPGSSFIDTSGNFKNSYIIKKKFG